jgi:hypothetical protein
MTIRQPVSCACTPRLVNSITCTLIAPLGPDCTNIYRFRLERKYAEPWLPQLNQHVTLHALVVQGLHDCTWAGTGSIALLSEVNEVCPVTLLVTMSGKGATMCKGWMDCLRVALALLLLMVVPPLVIFITWFHLLR